MINIKRSADGQDGGLSILEEDMTNVDTSYPLIPDSLQDFELTEVSTERNKKDTGNNLVIKMKTTREIRAAKTGDIIPAGFPCTTRLSLTETDKMDEKAIKKNVAKFTKAVGVPKLTPLEQFIGKLVTSKVTIQPEQNGFDAQNRFAFVELKK